MLPPGPRAPKLIQSGQYFKSPLEFLTRCHQKYGDIFCLKIIGYGNSIYINDPEDVKTVFTGDPDALHAGEANFFLAKVLGDNSVLVLDGPAHMRQRKLLLPPFHGERMHAYAEVMRDVTNRSIDSWRIGHSFPIHDYTRDITLEVILRTVFGVDRADELKQLEVQLAELMGAISSPMTLIAAFSGVLARFLFKARELKEKVDRLLYQQMEYCRSLPNLEERTDVLSMLLLTRDEDGQPMTDVELRDELMTLLAAGHETTATSLAWTIYHVLNDAKVVEKIKQEVQDVTSGEPLNASHLPKLNYLDAVVREGLRLRPVIAEVGRVIKKPFKLRDYELEPGDIVIPCIFLTHRRPQLYPDPERFDPDRFLDKKADPYEWYPFGGGIRRCLGAAFALYEMKIVLAQIFLRTDLAIASHEPPKPVWRTITMAPSDGTLVRLINRKAL